MGWQVNEKLECYHLVLETLVENFMLIHRRAKVEVSTIKNAAVRMNEVPQEVQRFINCESHSTNPLSVKLLGRCNANMILGQRAFIISHGRSQSLVYDETLKIRYTMEPEAILTPQDPCQHSVDAYSERNACVDQQPADMEYENGDDSMDMQL